MLSNAGTNIFYKGHHLDEIAKEANHCWITITTKISNHFNLYISGKIFWVQVNFCENKWRVNFAAVPEHDPGCNTPITDSDWKIGGG